ncbi:MAG: hypothetical protein Q7U75_10865, partial [Desulfobacterales bacterium]|nr:hypothetical protein [Desulfobacterales bacterium]
MKTFLPSWFLYYILLVGAAFVLLTSSYQQDLAVRVLLAGIVAVGLRPLVGLAGLISIGHAGFLAIGAYVSAILTSRAG